MVEAFSKIFMLDEDILNPDWLKIFTIAIKLSKFINYCQVEFR